MPIVGQRIYRPAHARLEQWFELPAQFAVRQRLERGAGGKAQIGLRPAERSFPFRALEQPRSRARLDRLRVAIAYAAHAQQQSFLVKLAFGSIEINGDFGGVLACGLEAVDKRDFLKDSQAFRRNLELDLEFLWRRHCRSAGLGMSTTKH